MAKLIGGIVVVVIVIGAFFIWQGRQVVAPGDRPSSDVEESPVGSGDATTSMEAMRKKMATSIKDAMGLGTQMRCTFVADEKSGTLSTVYVAGNQFMTKTIVGGVLTNALFDGTTQYIWTDGSKEGMKMDVTCLKNLSLDTTKSQSSVKDYQAEFDLAKNVQCEPVELDPPIAMSIPKDVSFTDQCAMMQESLKMMEQVKEKLPAGVTIPNMAY